MRRTTARSCTTSTSYSATQQPQTCAPNTSLPKDYTHTYPHAEHNTRACAIACACVCDCMCCAACLMLYCSMPHSRIERIALGRSCLGLGTRLARALAPTACVHSRSVHPTSATGAGAVAWHALHVSPTTVFGPCGRYPRNGGRCVSFTYQVNLNVPSSTEQTCST